MINALTAVGELMTLIDFTLSNARRFYSSMGNPLAVIGLKLRPSKRIPEDPSEFLTFLSKIGSYLTSANKLTDGGEKWGIKEKSSCTFLISKKKRDNK